MLLFYIHRGKATQMKKASNLILFVLVNIIVSALTTLSVLWIWDLTHPVPEYSDQTPLSSAENRSDSPTSQDPADENGAADLQIDFIEEDFDVKILTIVGAGNLDVEYVEIINQSQGPIDLTHWQLVDQQGNKFTFPALILNNEGSVKVLSKRGDNTVIELYWQSDAPIWQSGEIASLLDPAGNQITTYSIP